MSGSPLVIESTNLSVAWAKALLQVLESPGGKCRPLIVSVGGFENELPPEDEVIRNETDKVLKATPRCNVIDISAMVIFPYKLWLRRKNLTCEEFCSTSVDQLFPRLVALDSRNKHGTYFTRMMAHESVKKGKPVIVNQVSEVVDRLKRKQHFRATGLQMTCFNPAADHTRQTRLGFPCLQHVGITYEGDSGIAVTGFYPSQHIFDRAYGNYLGLAHLGRFLGFHSNLALKRVTCIATRPLLGTPTKTELGNLKSVIQDRLGSTYGES